ncbi:hypothetical protein [Oceanivirga salmonicida]|uniref:hypothetical protein n=1 Tax=Oceanivirga salmonicida TaxID=1769291 RepID=UPI000834E150|nr:hypothetical protein [Oceanivirga salmonicida]
MEQIQEYFYANPSIAYYLVGVVALIFGVASLMGKAWAIDPGSYRQKQWYNFLGPKWFSRIIGVFSIFVAIICFAGATFLF